MLRLFDTHAHLDGEEFDEDREQLIRSLPENGVALCLAAAVDLESSAANIALAERYPNILASIGVHPQIAMDIPAGDLEQLKVLAANRRVVVVGEIGLDYYHNDYGPRDLQMRCFEQQLELVRQVRLPAMYHIRDAWGDFMPMVKRGVPTGVMHCFSGSVEIARECLNAGMVISLAGPVTFKNARNLHEVARYVPLDRLVVETDSPYLSPEPVRGKRNDPRNVRHTAAAIALLRGMDGEEFAEAAFQNACRLFSVNEHGEKL
jgi:TatD DNase family protein